MKCIKKAFWLLSPTLLVAIMGFSSSDDEMVMNYAKSVAQKGQWNVVPKGYVGEIKILDRKHVPDADLYIIYLQTDARPDYGQSIFCVQRGMNSVSVQAAQPYAAVYGETAIKNLKKECYW